MANRAMAAKVERAKREAREAAAQEYGKAFYGVKACDRTREHEELSSAVERFLDGGGQVKRIACTGKSPMRTHRGAGFVADRSQIVYGTPVRGVMRHVYAGESRLVTSKVT